MYIFLIHEILYSIKENENKNKKQNEAKMKKAIKSNNKITTQKLFYTQMISTSPVTKVQIRSASIPTMYYVSLSLFLSLNSCFGDTQHNFLLFF